MIGYLFAFLAVIVLIPLAFLLAGGKPSPKPTAHRHPHGHARTKPAEEGAVPEPSDNAPRQPPPNS